MMAAADKSQRCQRWSCSRGDFSLRRGVGGTLPFLLLADTYSVTKVLDSWRDKTLNIAPLMFQICIMGLELNKI